MWRLRATEARRVPAGIHDAVLCGPGHMVDDESLKISFPVETMQPGFF